MAERYPNRWTVGPYTIFEVAGHGFPRPDYPELMYRYEIDGKRVDNELYVSLDRALVAAVGARHMGPRGAGGPGVGTAADWFCKMIDLDEAEAEEREQAEPTLAAPEQCSGAGRSWTTSTNAPDPACRVCAVTYRELGVDRPEQVFGGYSHLGHLPPHVAR
jgi:hypothetical protein